MKYPRVTEVKALEGKRVLVTFSIGERKIYDCTPLLAEEGFRPLENDTLFQRVHADKHGYGIVWSDEIDLAESELWLHGTPAEQEAAAEASKPHG